MFGHDFKDSKWKLKSTPRIFNMREKYSSKGEKDSWKFLYHKKSIRDVLEGWVIVQK